MVALVQVQTLSTSFYIIVVSSINWLRKIAEDNFVTIFTKLYEIKYNLSGIIVVLLKIVMQTVKVLVVEVIFINFTNNQLTTL